MQRSPSRRAVFITRSAISPRLATRIEGKRVVRAFMRQFYQARTRLSPARPRAFHRARMHQPAKHLPLRAKLRYPERMRV
jgi:hypothetical protein